MSYRTFAWNYLITAALMLLVLVHYGNCLDCFICGTYNLKDSGSITPCPGHELGEKVKCGEDDKYCLKYFNQGVTVRSCMKTCNEKSTTDTTFYCCQEDGCNGAKSDKPVALFVCLTGILIAVYNRL